MTESEQEIFRRVRAAYFERTSGPLADLREAARARNVLPILADWTGFVALHEDGQMSNVETEPGPTPASSEPGPLARHLAAIRGAELFPELSFLRPVVGPDWILCGACRGTGRWLLNGEEVPGVTCTCGGLGKIPPSLRDALTVARVGTGRAVSSVSVEGRMSAAPSTKQRTVAMVFFAVSAVLSVAWFIEAFTRGRGFVSKYLAPIAIVGNLLGSFLMWKQDRGSRSPPI
jgi:hypothetical protein